MCGNLCVNAIYILNIFVNVYNSEIKIVFCKSVLLPGMERLILGKFSDFRAKKMLKEFLQLKC